MTDLGTMTTAQLDKLISDAAQERAKRPDPQPAEPPQMVMAASQPAWNANADNGTMVLSFLHGAFGWVSFALEKARVADIASYMLRVTLAGHLDAKRPSFFCPVIYIYCARRRRLLSTYLAGNQPPS